MRQAARALFVLEDRHQGRDRPGHRIHLLFNGRAWTEKFRAVCLCEHDPGGQLERDEGIGEVVGRFGRGGGALHGSGQAVRVGSFVHADFPKFTAV
jgi:hypothetical protein